MSVVFLEVHVCRESDKGDWRARWISRWQVYVREQLICISPKVNGNGALQYECNGCGTVVLHHFGSNGLQVASDGTLEERGSVAIDAGGISVQTAQARQLLRYAGVVHHCQDDELMFCRTIDSLDTVPVD